MLRKVDPRSVGEGGRGFGCWRRRGLCLGAGYARCLGVRETAGSRVFVVVIVVVSVCVCVYQRDEVRRVEERVLERNQGVVVGRVNLGGRNAKLARAFAVGARAGAVG